MSIQYPARCPIGGRYIYDSFDAVNGANWTYNNCAVSGGYLKPSTPGATAAYAALQTPRSAMTSGQELTVEYGIYLPTSWAAVGTCQGAGFAGVQMYSGISSGIWMGVESWQFTYKHWLTIRGGRVRELSSADATGLLFQFKIVATRTYARYYLNGVLEQEGPHDDLDLAQNILLKVSGYDTPICGSPDPAAFWSGYFYAHGPMFTGGSACTGDVPTAHKIYPGASGNPGLLAIEEKMQSAEDVRQFHSQLKGAA